MKKYQVKINGMTCTGCEQQIDTALNGIGAKNIETIFQRGESVFELPDDINAESVRQAIKQANYQPEEIEEISLLDLKSFELHNKDDYDLLIIGSGGAAFSAAIKSIEYGAKVGIIEREIVGGTVVNIRSITTKKHIRTEEINHITKENSIKGLQTSEGEVELSTLVNQKDELVSKLRNQKYIDLIDEYSINLIKGEAKFFDENT